MPEYTISHDQILETIASDSFPEELLASVILIAEQRLSFSSVLSCIEGSGKEGVALGDLSARSWRYRNMSENERNQLIVKLMKDHGVRYLQKATGKTGRPLKRLVASGFCVEAGL